MSRKLLLLLFALVLLGSGLTVAAYYGYFLQEYREVPMDFSVRAGVVGINANADALHFGGIPPGGGSVRRMTITPANDGRLVFRFTGAAAPYVLASENNIRVVRGVPFTLNFTVTTPADMAEGNYTGLAKFYLYR